MEQAHWAWQVAAAGKSSRYQSTADSDDERDRDRIAICSPTPVGNLCEPHNCYIHAAGKEFAERQRIVPASFPCARPTLAPRLTSEGGTM